MVNGDEINFGPDDDTLIPTKNELEQAKVLWLKAEAMKRVRSQRDYLLSSTDWEVTRALEKGETPDTKLMEYRQALRDLPNDTVNCSPKLTDIRGFLTDVHYPVREY